MLITGSSGVFVAMASSLEIRWTVGDAAGFIPIKPATYGTSSGNRASLMGSDMLLMHAAPAMALAVVEKASDMVSLNPSHAIHPEMSVPRESMAWRSGMSGWGRERRL